MFTEGFNYICEQLNNNGFKAYAVGGAVRDYLLGKECGDIDIATSATPQEIISVFAKEKKVLTGLKHGTVGVVVKKVLYEVTTFRQDGNYLDNRHPDSVNFVTDLSLDTLHEQPPDSRIQPRFQEGSSIFVFMLKDRDYKPPLFRRRNRSGMLIYSYTTLNAPDLV